MGRVGRVETLCAFRDSTLANVFVGSGVGGKGKRPLVGGDVGGVTRLEASVVSTGSQGVRAGNGRKQKSDGGESVEQHFEVDSLMLLYRLKGPVLYSCFLV